jgi:hypothetical protein
MRNIRLAIAAALAVATASAAPVAAQQATTPRATPATRAASPAIDTLAIRAHTRYLADDLLEGRGAGTRGEWLAAAYIESQLIRLGLEPVGGSYRHSVPLVAARIEDGTRMTLRRGATTRSFESPRDFVWNTGGAGAFRDFAGRAVFAGAPQQAAAALRGRDLRGRVIVVDGMLGAAATELVPDWIRRGVAGIIGLAREPGHYDLVARSRGAVRYYVDASLDDPVWQPDLPVAVAGPELSAALLEAGGHAAAAQPPIDLAAELSAEIRITREARPAANIAARIPGTDPRRRHELVVYTAHYDHLGIGVPDETGDSIYNGFSDNAAGVAMLLAIAGRMIEQPPARSVVFLFFTAEERGLLGSTHFAASPPFALGNVRALINLDAGAPPAPPTSWRIAAGPRSDALLDDARSIASARGWKVEIGAATPNSDHWPFAVRNVPAIFIMPGAEWEGTSIETARALRARWERYHQPGDRWNAEFPFAGLGRYAGFALLIGERVANAP